MATTLYPATHFLTSVEYKYGRGNNDNDVNGSPQGWTPNPLKAYTNSLTNTTWQCVAGPTGGIELTGGGTPRYEFVSPPIDADVTISGMITFNVWALQSAMTVNATARVIVQRISGQTGAIAETVVDSTLGTEFGTSASAYNWTASPTSTQFYKGDRIRIRFLADDATGVNMGSGTATFYFGDGDPAGGTGDSYVTFTETFGLMADPTGTTIYPTNTASDVSTANIDREAWTSRGAGVQSDPTTAVAGWTSPIQVTDTAGGTAVDWFTKRLNALTLQGPVLVNVRVGAGSSATGTIGCEIAVVDNDGSNPVVWATNEYAQASSGVGTTEAAYQFWLAGDDLSVAGGKRLRIRFFIDDQADAAMQSGTMTLYYAGTTGGASGDTYLTFNNTLTEFSATVVEGSFTANAIIKREQVHSFSIDASIFGAGEGQLTADAIIQKLDQPGSFTLDSIFKLGGLASFTANAIVKKTVENAKTVFLQEYTFGTGGFAGWAYRQSLTYSDAADGAGQISGGGGNPPQVGQAYNFGGGGYYFVGQMQIRFDLSSLPANATILSARLHLDGHGDNSNVDFDMQVYKSTHSVAEPAYANGRTATQLASLPLLGEMNTADWIFDTNINTRYWNYIDLDESQITLGGNLDLVIASQRQVDLQAPSATTAGDEYVFPANDFYGEGPMLELTYTVGSPVSVDAWIARGGTLMTADAIIRRIDQPGSFTVDAVIQGSGGGTVEKTFYADAIIRVPREGSISADAIIKWVPVGSLSADAVIFRPSQTGSFSADAVIFRTQETSFGASAWIYSPREDPDGPGEPGETPMVSIMVDDVDITADVLLADAQFTMLVNGAVGSFKFRVRDDEHVHDFTTGAEVTLDIDGHRKFGGYLVKPMRGYAFPVQDTSVPGNVSRFWTLEGVDYNILFTKRVLYDKSDPASVELRKWAAGSHDDVVIKYVFDHYTDLPSDGATYNGVQHIGSPNPDKTGVVGSGGLTFGDAMREINRLISGVWYFDPFKDLHFVDVDTPDAPYGMSDNPGPGEVGFREFTQIESGTRLVNDAMVWGAGLGARKIAFGREQNAASQTAHGLWQYGEFTGNLYKQASVDLRADTIVNGTPQSKRGGKDDQESWSVITFEKSFAVGQKVAIESEVFNKSDVVPIRRMTVTFPVKNKPMFMLTLSHEIDLPWNLFEFWFPPFVRPDIDIDIGGGGTTEDPPVCETPYDGWFYDEGSGWEWDLGFGDGVYANKDLSPGWGFDGDVFYLDVAADGINLPPDSVHISLHEMAQPATFAWLRGGPIVIRGTFTLPDVFQNDRSAGVAMGVFFDGGAEGGLTWSYDLVGDPGYTTTHNRLTLINYLPSDQQNAPEVVTPGFHSFEFYVYPTGGRIVVDGTTLALSNGLMEPGYTPWAWPWHQLGDIRVQLGESGSAGDEGVYDGGRYEFTITNIARLDGTAPPWCGKWETPSGEGRSNLVGDGTTTVFTLTDAYVPLTTQVFVNGLFQRPGIEYTENSPSTGQITFTTAPAVGAIIAVIYQVVPGEL